LAVSSLSAGLLIVLAFSAIPNAAAADKPNILINFTNFQGYADLGCYGNQRNKTPGL